MNTPSEYSSAPTGPSSAPDSRKGLSRRAGRVLVECCVALVLLSAGSTLVLLSAAGTATLVDASLQEDRVQRAQAAVDARVQQGACASGPATTYSAPWGPRLVVTEDHVANDSIHRVQLLATWKASILASFHDRTVAASTAGLCE